MTVTWAVVGAVLLYILGGWLFATNVQSSSKGATPPWILGVIVLIYGPVVVMHFVVAIMALLLGLLGLVPYYAGSASVDRDGADISD